MPTCWEAIQEVFSDEKGVLTTKQVIDKIYKKYPSKPWKSNTISAHLMGMSINHTSRHHYRHSSKHAMLYSLGKGRYRRVKPGIDDVQAPEDMDNGLGVNEIVETDKGISLSLERDLEGALLRDLRLLEAGLKVYEKDGRNGYKFNTGVVGELDMLAIDASGNLVVIELKAGDADERTCAQILRYMGWVKREISEEGSVRGIIVAHRFHERVKYVVETIPAIKLMRYEVNFRFVAE